MIYPSTDTNNMKLDLGSLDPEVIWLEPQHFQIAKEMSNDKSLVKEQKWPTYLNALALLGFEEWLAQRKPELEINYRDREPLFNTFCNLKFGKFKLCLISISGLFETTVDLPQDALENHNLAAHFYVVVEVVEEQQHVVIRGFLRHDQLQQSIQKYSFKPKGQEKNYTLPVSLFDSRLDRLLIYSRFLKPDAIPLPPEKPVSHLSAWLKEVVEIGWETWDTLEKIIEPKQVELIRVRSGYVNVRKAKGYHTNSERLNTNQRNIEPRIRLLGTEIKQLEQPIALSVSPTAIDSSKFKILVKVCPTGELSDQDPELQMILLDDEEHILAETKAKVKNTKDINLNFDAELGDTFSIRVVFGDVSFTEKFMI